MYWTAFIGLFFDYYDLYLFIYLERALATQFALGEIASHWLQFTGLAGVGFGALGFGYLADRIGRGRTMLVVFGVYVLGIAGLSLAWSFESLLVFRLVASLALGAEWGISHTYLAERVRGAVRYRFSALLQFSILGGLLAALMSKFALPLLGWRVLFAASIVPVVILSLVRWKMLAGGPATERRESPDRLQPAVAKKLPAFLLCLALASLTIASGTMNVFYAKELPQSTVYTVLFWGLVAPGMLTGAWLVKRFGVGRTLAIYAVCLAALSLGCGLGGWSGRKLAFALGLALINGVPFGLMGAFFNEVFAEYRTMLSGAAYNLGRVLAGSAPWLVAALGLHTGDRYVVFTAILAALVLLISVAVAKISRELK
ncbi:MAG TPA: MFS transporter [Candidatus Didemnitutus sp.]|nr:MFS transporter [Candidatus Didemnitutus sp.]